MAWIKTADLTGTAFVALHLTDADGRVLGTYATPPVAGTASWQHVKTEVTVPEGALGAVSLQVTGTGSAWFDGVVLTEPQSESPPQRP